MHTRMYHLVAHICNRILTHWNNTVSGYGLSTEVRGESLQHSYGTTNKANHFEYQNPPKKPSLFPASSTWTANMLKANTVHRHVRAPSVPKTECWGSSQRIPGLSILMPWNDTTSMKKLRILIYSILRALHNYIYKSKETDSESVSVLYCYVLFYRTCLDSPEPSSGKTKYKKKHARKH